jgi:hypothetical protein
MLPANPMFISMMKKTFPFAALFLITSTLTGCGDYMSRRETLSPHAGDAVAANKVIHTIDPWPRASQNTNIPANGERMQRVIESYRKREDGAESATAAQGAQATGQ